MKHSANDALLKIAGVILLIGQGLMALAAIACLAGAAMITFFNDTITAEIREEYADPTLIFPTVPAITACLLAGLAVAGLFYFFKKMRAIVDTVQSGDPFMPQNAERLSAMAWIMLGIQVLAIPLAGLGLYVEKVLEGANATVDAGLDLSGIIMVLTLFILARVFRHGTQMRDDLEGTV